MNVSIIRLRTIATLAVIMIHVSAIFLYQPINKAWLIGGGFDSVSRFCVPLFLMISGALLLGKSEPAKVFVKKRMSKILIPFVAWGIFYYAFDRKFSLSSMSVDEMSLSFLKGENHFHLWYLYLIIPIYLIIPLLQRVVSQLSTKILLYYICLSFVVTGIDKTAMVFFDIDVPLYEAGFSVYLSYVVLGYLMIKRNLFQNHVKLMYVLGGVGAFITFSGTYLHARMLGMYNGYFFDYTSVNVLFLTIGVTLFFLQVKAHASNLTLAISENSFGIYLVHPLFIYYARPVIELWTSNTWLHIGSLFVVVTGVSWLAAFVMKKTPFLRHCV